MKIDNVPQSAEITRILNSRIMILDGAMGTMIQSRGLSESDFRGAQFSGSKVNLSGNYDVLSLSQPQLIEDIHAAYLEAGADIITTNTFGANGISLADYNLEDLVYPLNVSSAGIFLKPIPELLEKQFEVPQDQQFLTLMWGWAEQHSTLMNL